MSNIGLLNQLILPSFKKWPEKFEQESYSMYWKIVWKYITYIAFLISYFFISSRENSEFFPKKNSKLVRSWSKSSIQFKWRFKLAQKVVECFFLLLEFSRINDTGEMDNS
jgi:hypothetical protein